MPDLTEEEKRILRQAYEIKERIRAEELEAGEISVEEADRQAREEAAADFRRPQVRDADAFDDIEIQVDDKELKEAIRQEKQEERRKVQQQKQQLRRQKLDQGKEKLQEQRELMQQEQAALQQRQEVYSRKEEKKRLKQEEKQLKRDKRQLRKQKRHPADGQEYQPRRRKKSFLHRLLTIVVVLLLVIALLLLGVYVFLRQNISLTNYEPYETAYVRADDVLHDPGVYNILLIGTDNRVPGNDDNHSDAMIVVSINSRKRRLVMTSIMRDSYVNIPGRGMDRINEAYFYGGPALLIQTIEENYKLGIDNYIQVDFFNFVDVIDALGGVTVDVQQSEIIYVNGYINEYNRMIGLDPESGFLGTDQYGVQQLTGRQALGYARIRYTDINGSSYDFGRTERQRIVLNAMMDKAKHSNPLAIYRAVKSILPDLTTDITDDKMCGLIMKALIYLTYDMQQARCPLDGTWENARTETGQEVLTVDFEANKSYLQSTIYD